MEEPGTPSHEVQFSTCPACGQVVTVTDPSIEAVVCPHCGQEFSPAESRGCDVESADAPSSETATDAAPDDREDELSALRIRQVSTLRRGLARTQSYYLLGIALCIGGAAQLVFLAVDRFREGARTASFVYFVVAVVLLMVCPRWIRRVRQLSAELKHSAMEPARGDPDFSSLSDGSQRWRDLEGLGGGIESNADQK